METTSWKPADRLDRGQVWTPVSQEHLAHWLLLVHRYHFLILAAFARGKTYIRTQLQKQSLAWSCKQGEAGSCWVTTLQKGSSWILTKAICPHSLLPALLPCVGSLNISLGATELIRAPQHHATQHYTPAVFEDLTLPCKICLRTKNQDEIEEIQFACVSNIF